jgi:hypothetical protein
MPNLESELGWSNIGCLHLLRPIGQQNGERNHIIPLKVLDSDFLDMT